MRTVKIFFLAVIVIGLFSMIGCTKNNTTTVYTKDSVFTSNWITLAMDSNSTNQDWEQTISAPAITASILDHGVVLGYGAYVINNTDTLVEQALEFNMFQTFSVGSILLQTGQDLSGLLIYRYVIVPGSILAGTKLTPQQLKSMNYTEVTKLLSTAGKTGSASTLSTQ
ncbi:MAG TPA: hypothetical protein VG052_07620 [Puia sp.]|nr:hypothetical protein [Puia sp.]